MSSRVLLALVLVVVIVAGCIAWYFLWGRGALSSSSSSSMESGPIRVTVLDVEKGVDAVKTKVAESGGVETWSLYYVNPGLNGVLLRIKAENRGSETYAVGLVLITSKGRQLGLLHGDMGITLAVVSPQVSMGEQKVLFEKAKEYPREYMQAIIAGTLELAPGASTEQILLYGLQPGEEPVKLHVIAKSITGKVVEFDVPINK